MFSQNAPPQHIGLNITKIGTASASPASGWNGCSYGMFRSVNGFWTEAIPIASDIKTSHLCCLSLALVFDTTSPGKGGGWNRAGARHGSFTPPRFSRSCVQEYHCKLTGSWRSSLPKLHLTWVGIALHLPLAVLICGSCSAQVVLAHPV